MRKFSEATTIQSQEAICPDKIQIAQTDTIVVTEKQECNPGRTGMNIQPYRTEFRNIFK